MRPIQEQIILVTGATDGLGRGIARELVRRGATVLVHGRDENRIRATLAELDSGKARSYRADFASLDEVRGMAREILDREERLDALVNNAGIGTNVPGGGERMLSKDGYELRFAVNYLAHYLLTHDLLPLISRSTPARIVNVSSAGQTGIDFGDPMLEHHYSGMRAYCQSKLAQILFTLDLAEELGDSPISVNALHPATYMPTKIVTSPASTLEEGIRATVRLVLDPEIEGVTGRYFDGLRESNADAQAYDKTARRNLRELSDELIAAS